MPVKNVASDWPRTFLHPRCFCLALYIPLLAFAKLMGPVLAVNLITTYLAI